MGLPSEAQRAAQSRDGPSYAKASEGILRHGRSHCSCKARIDEGWACHPKPSGRRMAEREGFEPSVGCPTHAFQACALDHSATSPEASPRPAKKPWRLLKRGADKATGQPTVNGNLRRCPLAGLARWIVGEGRAAVSPSFACTRPPSRLTAPLTPTSTGCSVPAGARCSRPPVPFAGNLNRTLPSSCSPAWPSVGSTRRTSPCSALPTPRSAWARISDSIPSQ